MKKAVILFIIFLIILGAGIAEHFFVHKTFDAFNERIEKIEPRFKTTTLIPHSHTPKTCKTSGQENEKSWRRFPTVRTHDRST